MKTHRFIVKYKSKFKDLISAEIVPSAGGNLYVLTYNISGKIKVKRSINEHWLKNQLRKEYSCEEYKNTRLCWYKIEL